MKKFFSFVVGTLALLALGAGNAGSWETKFNKPEQIFPFVNGPLGTVTVIPSGTIQMAQGGTISLQAIMWDTKEGTLTTVRMTYQNRNILQEWSCSNGGTFTPQEGLTTVYQVPYSDGTYTVVFQAEDVPGSFGSPTQVSVGTITKSATTTFVVSTPRPTSVSFSPVSATMTVCGTKTFSLLVFDQTGGRMFDEMGTFSFGGGTVTPTRGTNTTLTAGTKTGTFLLVATVNNLTATATVTIIPGTLSYIAVIPATATIGIEGTKTFTAKGYDTHGNFIPELVFSWKCTIGSINLTGTQASTQVEFFAGTQAGIGSLTASYGTISGYATITVTTPPSSFVVPPMGTAGIGFSAQVVVFGYYSGPATITSNLGSSTPGTITVINGRWNGSITNTLVGTNALTCHYPNGSITSNEILIVAGDFATATIEGLGAPLSTNGYPWGTVTVKGEDSFGNETAFSKTGTLGLQFTMWSSKNGGPWVASKRGVPMEFFPIPMGSSVLSVPGTKFGSGTKDLIISADDDIVNYISVVIE